MSEEQAKILKRVRKMMNLANNAGATEGERDNALRMAHSTLAKYNLDIAQVEDNLASGDKQNADEPRERMNKVYHGTVWTRQISMAVAQLFFCSYFYQRLGPNTDKAQHSFVGRHSNAVTAQGMSEYLVTSVHREAQQYMRAVGGNYKQYRAFAQGAMHRIVMRCDALRRESAQQTAEVAAPKQPGMALVLASVYEKEQQANKMFLERQGLGEIRVAKGGHRNANDLGAKIAGARYGEGISLNRQIK